MMPFFKREVGGADLETYIKFETLLHCEVD